MNVIALSEVEAGAVELVGGKAAGLAEMIGAGERVPEGFCLTTTAHRSGKIPEEEVRAAYERLGAGPVAVRSSATAEDRPEAAFAGQQDTFLDVTGAEELLGTVRKCWDSLHTERAVAYREAHGIEHDAVHMAVVVQRMIDPAVAGVLFTANPVTGCRTEMIVDAAPGLGTAVVDGTVVPDHYVLDGSPQHGGCLDRAQLDELRQAGERLHEHFGVPQDIEWALDHEGKLWLLQSRPITTLFPLPPETDRPLPRVYLELAGNFQGVLQPFTPMGMSVLQLTLAGMAGSFGGNGDSRPGPEIIDIGGRPYLDLTGPVRDKEARKWLPTILATDFGPRVRDVIEQVLADPRFSPLPERQTGGGPKPTAMLRWGFSAVIGIARALARPDAARHRVFAELEKFRRRAADPAGPCTAADRLRFVRQNPASLWPVEMIWPMLAGMLAAAAPATLLKGIAGEDEVNTVLGGMPHNVTTEMDLALWRLAAGAGEHRELLRNTPPDELAARYHAGTLPDIGLATFLDTYGHRAAAEIDIGVPRWDEDPAPVFAAIANYLRVTDPQQAPDRRFERSAAEAEAKLIELARRGRRKRPIRGRLAGFLLRRARSLAGLREVGKFAGLYPLRRIRRQLLLVGAELAERGLLERADGIVFLTVAEAETAVVDGTDHRDLVTSRKSTHERELRRSRVPIALLSDGTDVEALAAPQAAEDGALPGMPAAPGKVTGPARVIRDAAGAHIEPGEILVAPNTDPGWTPLFLTAGGLVTETGAPIAHGPTVAREYGIPAVICVRDATHAIENGQMITIDGAAGTVTIAR